MEKILARLFKSEKALHLFLLISALLASIVSFFGYLVPVVDIANDFNEHVYLYLITGLPAFVISLAICSYIKAIMRTTKSKTYDLPSKNAKLGSVFAMIFYLMMFLSVGPYAFFIVFSPVGLLVWIIPCLITIGIWTYFKKKY